ncbi:DUF2316 family protein [Cellulomonas sp. PhB143]|uniref:DUF2316 family protein n=1 Tax=Cellulomonas sp. PhB143 TaxID=2485186 RepID=UPI000F49214E|nr:DUF2316 family protein [Cellulomonas sp. PhB143]ROS79123.1 hypothetical protein EDF32_0005 [Cellulomonas sp. PhB143]
MTLNDSEREQTSRELRANLALSGLSADDLAGDLGLAVSEVEETLDVGPASERERVWLLREYLDQKVCAQGRDPLPYTVL